MAANPPAQIHDLYKHIQTLDTHSLTQQPYYVDPQAFSGPATPSPLLRLATLRNAAWQENYHSVQEAFFDFAGRCMQCANTKKHIHGMQASPVLEVVGFPGLYIYPKLLSNGLVHKDLIDTLLHDELANPATRTNLHENHHVTSPEPSKKDGVAHRSFFDPLSSQLKLQPRLQENDDWAASPLTTRAFVEKLRWFTTGDVSAGGVSKVGNLVESILPIKARSTTAYVSSCQDSLGLRQNKGEASTILDISLGCDAVFIVSLEQPDDEVRNAVSTEPQSVDDESWRDLVNGLDSEDDESAPSRPHDVGTGTEDDSNASKTSNAPRLAAIHLRSTDGVLFTGPSRQAWYGVAKVLPETLPTFEQQWPCWPGTVERRGMEEWKGCMKGRRIDLVVR